MVVHNSLFEYVFYTIVKVLQCEIIIFFDCPHVNHHPFINEDDELARVVFDQRYLSESKRGRTRVKNIHINEENNNVKLLDERRFYYVESVWKEEQ